MEIGTLIGLAGLILTLPLSIAGALLTPRIEKAYNNLSTKKRYKNIQKVKAEYEIVKKYKEDKQEFSLYLLNIVIKTTLMGAIMSVVSGFFILVSQLIASDPFLIGIAQIVNMAGSVFIVSLCRPAFSIWSKIKNYDEYVQRLKDASIIEIEIEDSKFY